MVVSNNNAGVRAQMLLPIFSYGVILYEHGICYLKRGSTVLAMFSECALRGVGCSLNVPCIWKKARKNRDYNPRPTAI
jgi:hypothetical protein